MNQDFATALDELITRYKARDDADIGTMAADMRGAADGLDAELADEE